MTQFKLFETYYGRFITDYDLKIFKSFVKRTAKNIWDENGNRFKIHIHDGVEFIYPDGRYSFAPTIKADMLV